MRALHAHRLPPAFAPLALAAALACSDTPPAAPAAPPAALDAALPVVVADTALPRPGADSARPALAPRAAAVGRTAVAVSPPIQLGTLGGPHSQAFGINSLGHIVGRSTTATNPFRFHAFLWTPERGMVDLGTLGGDFSDATDISDAGQVVGSSLTESGNHHAFLWSEGDGMADLGTLGGCCSGATAINAHGHVVGGSLTAEGANHAFIWTPEAGMRDLGTLGGFSGARDINDAGVIVGASFTPEGRVLAVRWTPDGRLEELGGLDGELEGWSSGANAVNEAGEIAGETSPPGSGTVYGFRWLQSTGFELLQTLGGCCTQPRAINDAGDIVGSSQDPSQNERGVMWRPGAPLLLFELLPGDAGSGTFALNNHGQVVGHSGAVVPRAVLWTVRTDPDGAPVVDRLHAVVLPPGVIPGLSGVWLRVRLTDPGDAGPWDWTIDWGDGAVHTTQNVQRNGEFAFLRAAPYTTGGPHTITVTATDPGGLTSAPATTSGQ